MSWAILKTGFINSETRRTLCVREVVSVSKTLLERGGRVLSEFRAMLSVCTSHGESFLGIYGGGSSNESKIRHSWLSKAASCRDMLLFFQKHMQSISYIHVPYNASMVNSWFSIERFGVNIT